MTVSMRFLSTPSARRATPCFLRRRQCACISIHALREEGDQKRRKTPRRCNQDFYPRPPRGGRRAHHATPFGFLDFYPRPPRGGRLYRATATMSSTKFLSTPSARRATHAPGLHCPGSRYFYPRPPRGGRPHGLQAGDVQVEISIHALREEGDLELALLLIDGGLFLSTPSARRATCPGS